MVGPNNFDPNSAATGEAGIFGLPFTREDAKLVLIPVPWEATVSYGDGASLGPELILNGSYQVDLFDAETGNAWKVGYYLEKPDRMVLDLNAAAKTEAKKIIAVGGDIENSPEYQTSLDFVNSSSEKLNQWVYEKTKKLLKAGKLVGLLGGDHSTPYGAIQAFSEHHDGDFGILHIDAHADLRKAYLGFVHAHASIMFNVMNSKFAPKKLVQVGIRDFCEAEFEQIQKNPKTIKTFFDVSLQRRKMAGENWLTICDEIVRELPQKVYLSFDIDGLDPQLCPGTGTPVTGGLLSQEAFALIRAISDSGRTIIGFDLNEVAPGEDNNEWNGNVGARVLYKLCGWTAISNGLSEKGPLTVSL